MSSEQLAMLVANVILVSVPFPWIWDWGLRLDNKWIELFILSGTYYDFELPIDFEILHILCIPLQKVVSWSIPSLTLNI